MHNDKSVYSTLLFSLVESRVGYSDTLIEIFYKKIACLVHSARDISSICQLKVIHSIVLRYLTGSGYRPTYIAGNARGFSRRSDYTGRVHYLSLATNTLSFSRAYW